MKDSMFDELLESVKEMDKIALRKKKASRRFVVREPEVKLIREQTGLSQADFARLIGVSKRTLENWEQGRRNPTGPARALLKIVESDPKGAVQALHS
jgi:putative transcriptional regulator